MYLKTNEPAREAVYHAVHQELLDGQAALASQSEEIRKLCQRIVDAQEGLSGSGDGRLQEFENHVRALSGEIQKNIQEAFSTENAPFHIVLTAGLRFDDAFVESRRTGFSPRMYRSRSRSCRT
jgi:hypothetical protein